MHDHALATTKPSKNNAYFYYYYFLQGGHNHFVFGIEWSPNPPPKHSVTLNEDVANSGLTLKSFSAFSGHQFTSPINLKGVNTWKLRPKWQIGKNDNK